MKELSYSKNTVFLMLAGVFSQVLGAALKILLSYRLHEEGMAVYQVAICVYTVFLTPVLFGMPAAVTQFISKKRGEKREDIIAGGVKFAFNAIFLSGAVFSILMLVSRRFFAISLKEPAAEYAVLLLSPSVFFVALGAFAKSCFEGSSNMLPCAVSQGVESCIKLILTYAFTCLFGIFSLKYAVAGAALAITLGEAFATSVLFIFMAPLLKKTRLFSKPPRIYWEIVSYALPVTLYAVILSSLNLLENSVIRNSLLSVKFGEGSAQKLLFLYSPFTSVFDTVKASSRLSGSGADWLYGAYFGYALTIIRFPAGLLRIFCVPFFPLASKCFAEKNTEKLSFAVSKIIKTILIISLPLSAFFMAFAPQITTAVFGSPAYSHMLAFSAPLLVSAPLCELLSTLWYAYGKTFPPFIFGFITSVLSIILSAVLIRVPYLNILGAAVSSVISGFAELLMLFIFTRRYLNIKAPASYRS